MLLDLYTDDTTLQASDPDLSVLEQKLNEDLESLSKWLNENRLVLNTDKTVCMILSTHQRRATLPNCTLNLKEGDKHIKQVNEAKLLGIIIDEASPGINTSIKCATKSAKSWVWSKD